MNVALCSPYGVERVSGISVFLTNLQVWLRTRGHVVRILTPENTTISVKLPRGLRDIGLALSTFREILASRPWTAVHANQPHLQSVAALIAARVLTARFVVTYHSPAPPADHRIAQWVQSVSQKLVSHFADEVVFVSEATRSDYPGVNGRVIRIGIDLTEIALARSSRRMAETRYTFLFAGRQTESKGFFDLLQAAGRLAPGKGKDFRLLVIGDTPSAERDSKQRFMEDLQDLVEDRGELTQRAEVLRTLAEADALILPSYREGLPLVVLEAMALECVPITTPVGGLSEVVRDRETGIIVPPGDIEALVDSMTWALSHPADMKEIGRRAGTFVRESFNFSDTLEQYLRLYSGLRAKSI